MATFWVPVLWTDWTVIWTQNNGLAILNSDFSQEGLLDLTSRVKTVFGAM